MIKIDGWEITKIDEGKYYLLYIKEITNGLTIKRSLIINRSEWKNRKDYLDIP